MEGRGCEEGEDYDFYHPARKRREEPEWVLCDLCEGEEERKRKDDERKRKDDEERRKRDKEKKDRREKKKREREAGKQRWKVHNMWV